MRKRAMRGRRIAFTMLELIVVIAIIAALVALTASATVKFLGVQQEANTKSNLAKIQSALSKSWSKVKDNANRDTTIPAGVQALAGSDPNAAVRSRVIYVKLKWRQAFPMNFAEAFNVSYTHPTFGTVPASPLQASSTYANYLYQMGVTWWGSPTSPTPSSAYVPQPYESSVCLLMALQLGVSGAGIDPADLTSGGALGNTSSLPARSDGFPQPNLSYLTDAWHQPIYFSRFPVGSTVLNPNGAQAGANDPGDPQGYLNSGVWTSSLKNTYSALTLQQLAPGSTGVALSYKMAPMVASGGTDKTPQFDTTTFTPTVVNDDLFSNP